MIPRTCRGLTQYTERTHFHRRTLSALLHPYPYTLYTTITLPNSKVKGIKGIKGKVL